MILLFAAVSYPVLSIWRGVSLSLGRASEEDLRKAIRFTPPNPDPYYQLGVLYQWKFRQADLKTSLKYLKEAIARNPLEQQYHLTAARILQRTGEGEAAREALDRAILAFPNGYEGRWVAGNLLLQQGALERALPHFSYILRHYPNQSGTVYDVLLKAIQDTDFILEKVVPRESFAVNQYLTHLYEIGDAESAKKAWRKKKAWSLEVGRPETIRHIDFLIAQGNLGEASQVWKARLREEKVPVSSDGNLVTNGGFEQNEVLGGGFDWKIVKIAGADVSFDDSVAFHGRRSLRIVFNGKENVDFYHVFQYVPVEPGREYLLRAHVKASRLTTQSGLKLEIRGVGQMFQVLSEPLIGDSGWKEIVIPFRTPASSHGVLVMARREKTDRFDRLISGTVWIDSVELREKSSSS